MGKSMKPGGGGRFAKMEAHMKNEGMKNPAAAAAKVGMDKYGKGKMEKMAAKGRARSRG